MPLKGGCTLSPGCDLRSWGPAKRGLWKEQDLRVHFQMTDKTQKCHHEAGTLMVEPAGASSALLSATRTLQWEAAGAASDAPEPPEPGLQESWD